jgi:hypothetical protein
MLSMIFSEEPKSRSPTFLSGHALAAVCERAQFLGFSEHRMLWHPQMAVSNVGCEPIVARRRYSSARSLQRSVRFACQEAL